MILYQRHTIIMCHIIPAIIESLSPSSTNLLLAAAAPTSIALHFDISSPDTYIVEKTGGVNLRMQITVFFISFCVSLIVFLITKNSESPRTREQTSLTGHTGRKFVRCFPTIRLLLLLLQLICIQIRAYEKWSSFGDSACDIMLLCVANTKWI